jgi:hypothetical protein
VLSDAGHAQEAENWRISAAARYDELVVRHPEAFVDHAAEFWLTVWRFDERSWLLESHKPGNSRTSHLPPRHRERLMGLPTSTRTTG